MANLKTVICPKCGAPSKFNEEEIAGFCYNPNCGDFLDDIQSLLKNNRASNPQNKPYKLKNINSETEMTDKKNQSKNFNNNNSFYSNNSNSYFKDDDDEDLDEMLEREFDNVDDHDDNYNQHRKYSTKHNRYNDNYNPKKKLNNNLEKQLKKLSIKNNVKVCSNKIDKHKINFIKSSPKKYSHEPLNFHTKTANVVFKINKTEIITSEYITSSVIFNYLKCPTRVWLDFHGDKNEMNKDENPYIKALWGNEIFDSNKFLTKIGEFEVIQSTTIDIRYKNTLQAMNNKTPLIYNGLLKHDNLIGMPDLLKKLPNDEYVPIDIKSGLVYENTGKCDSNLLKIKESYALQLCFYYDLLKKHNFSNHNKGEIIKLNYKTISFDLNQIVNKKNNLTWWSIYNKKLSNVKNIFNNNYFIRPSYSSNCDYCPWVNYCNKYLEGNNDLTNIFEIDNKMRNKIEKDLSIKNISDFLKINVEEVLKVKNEKKSEKNNFLHGIDDYSLKKAYNRAKVLFESKKPSFYIPITFPDVKCELFFNIGQDPTQDFIFLHGVYERCNNLEKYIPFFAKNIRSKDEKNAWEGFLEYINKLLKDDYVFYYSSSHLRSIYLKLHEKYPYVTKSNDILDFFDHPNAINLYDIIYKNSDWPLRNYSIKEIATYLGFKWRNEKPTTALSIYLYNEYINKKTEASIKRILEYHEDECTAIMFVKDKIIQLQEQ